MLSQYLRLCSYSRGGVTAQTTTMQVFGLWEEAGLLGENHGEKMETPGRKARSQESNLQLSPLQHRITLCHNSSPYRIKWNRFIWLAKWVAKSLAWARMHRLYLWWQKTNSDALTRSVASERLLAPFPRLPSLHQAPFVCVAIKIKTSSVDFPHDSMAHSLIRQLLLVVFVFFNP